MKCYKCSKNIESDSIYCKYCGHKVDNVEARTKENKRLINIFEGIYQTLFRNSSLTKANFDNRFEEFKNYENRILNNNDYYKIIVYVVFYSGFRSSTVDKYRNSIEKYFSDYRKVALYDENDIELMMNDGYMIRNSAKLKACIYNAKVLVDLINQFGSFMKYIESFSPEKDDLGLKRLRKNIIKEFDYIGEITSYHILTDIGLNVLKPDRVIMRIFYRLGLVNSLNDYWDAIIIGRKFSNALNLPIRYIDIIFVSYGQLNQDGIKSICTEINPKCDRCRISFLCNYYNSSVGKT